MMGLDTKVNIDLSQLQDRIKAVDVALVKEHPETYQLLASVSEQQPTVSFKVIWNYAMRVFTWAH